MLHLEKVKGNNVWDILKLTVSESQKNFVATNEISIIEAYTAKWLGTCSIVRHHEL